MRITLYCGICGAQFQTDAAGAGKIARCASCNAQLPIQSSDLDRPQIRLFCPQCHEELGASPEQEGEQLHCSKCGKDIGLPLIEAELE